MDAIRIRIMLIVALCVLGTWGGQASAKECRLLRYASFDMGKTESAVTIPVDVDGIKEQFLVDTGGIYSTISPDVAEKLHLDVRPVKQGLEFYATDGTLVDHYAKMPKLGIGGVYARNFQILIQPQNWGTGSKEFSGTLAPDLLRNFDLDFDFGQHKLNLLSPKHCEGRVVYWAKRYGTVPFDFRYGHIRVDITLDGHNLSAIVDTGSSNTVIREHTARQGFDLSPDAPGVHRINGVSPDALISHYYVFKHLTIGDVTVNNAKMRIMADAAEKSFRWRHDSKADRDHLYGESLDAAPVILGMDILSKLHLYVAYGERMLYVTPARAGLVAGKASASPSTTAATN